MLPLPAYPGPEAAISAPRILLVDDEPSVVRSLARALRVLRPNWRVEIAESGAAALRLLAKEPYDALVTDLEMPGLGGMALLASVRREYPGTLRLVHSSHIESEDVAEVRWLVQGALEKPARPSDMVRLIELSLSASAQA